MLQSESHDALVVKQWMQHYRLFQGIESGDREKIASRFLAFAALHQTRPSPLDDSAVSKVFSDLLGALYAEVPRGWISATSKLLWCLYPGDVVIYDTFVHRALTVMQCIDSDLTGFNRIGATPTLKGASDIANATKHYVNYQAMVRRLLFRHADLLNELRTQRSETYPYDIRILDKLLWMIGDPSEMRT